MAWFAGTHLTALLWQIVIKLYPFTNPYFPPVFVAAPYLLKYIYENEPAQFENPDNEFLKEYIDLFPKMGYTLEFTWNLMFDWGSLVPYDGKIHMNYFDLLGELCIWLYFMNNFWLINNIPLVAWLWSTD